MATNSSPCAWAVRALWTLLCVALATSAAAAAPGQDLAGLGAPFELIVQDGQLRPGTSNRLFVAAVAPTGDIASRAPRVTASVGSVEFDELVSDGVFAYNYKLPADADIVEFSIGVFGVRYTKRLKVYEEPASHLVLPKRIDGVVRGGEIEIVVTGEDLPPPEALQVVVGEGRVASIVEQGPDLLVRILPDDSPFPRHVIVGIRDATRLEQPAWTGLRLRARPRMNYTTEPGAKATFRVGERSYGPYEADEEGKIAGWVDQYPGEVIAHGIFVDRLGNETRTDQPLATKAAASLVAFPTGDFVVGKPAPKVYLHAVRGDGGLWDRAAPTCKTPALDLQARRLQKGDWLVPLPNEQFQRVRGDGDAADPQDMRIECRLGSHAEAALRVRVAEGIPERIHLRVWPVELRTDFPEAEISVMLEDARGERLGLGGLDVTAVRGDVRMGDLSGTGASGEYNGGNAASAGLDTVRATYSAPPSASYVDSVRLAWADVPKAGRVTLHGRALDPHLRPVPGAEIELDAGASVESGISGPDGWVSADVVIPMKKGPVQFRAAVAGRVDSALIIKGQPASDYGPGIPDLRADQVVKISSGRIAGISISVEPAVLRASPGREVAYVRVRLEDRAGKAVVNEPIDLTASEGVVGPLRPRPDGSYLAEYEPGHIDTPRDVTLTAEAENLHSTAKLSLQPQPVRVSLNAYGGLLTNFGAVSAPVFGVDLDFRVQNPLLGERLMIRIGAARYAFERKYRVKGELLKVDTSVHPFTAAALYRIDRGSNAVWFGGGAVLGLQRLKGKNGGEIIYNQTDLSLGPTLMGGVGQRLLGGEVFLTARATWLPGVGDSIAFDGNVGGLAVGAGYRVVF